MPDSFKIDLSYFFLTSMGSFECARPDFATVSKLQDNKDTTVSQILNILLSAVTFVEFRIDAYEIQHIFYPNEPLQRSLLYLLEATD